MLVEETIFGKIDKVQLAIDLIKEFEPEQGYYVAISGGKDSTVIYHLVKMAGVKARFYYNFTTVDPPELLRFLRDNFKDVEWQKPKYNMFQLIEKMGYPPTSNYRYCWTYLKEIHSRGETVIVGSRSNESFSRSKRGIVSYCIKFEKKFVRPIYTWTEEDVWEFHEVFNLPHCILYDEGWKRIGCVLCPLKSYKYRLKDVERYPNFVRAFKRAFERMLEARSERGNPSKCWRTGEEVFEWWMQGRGGNSIKDNLKDEPDLFTEGLDTYEDEIL